MSESSKSPGIVGDPVWYVTGALFALLTTALLGALGQRVLMPIAQTAAFWLLLLPAVRRGAVRPLLGMLTLWLVMQALAVAGLTWLLPASAESVVGDGFTYRAELLAWAFTDAPHPAGWSVQPLARAVELAGVTLGAAVSGGLLGLWFLLRSLTLWVFGAVAAWMAAGSAEGMAAVLAPWWVVRLVAYTLLVALLSSPGVTGEYNPQRWPPARRRLLLWAAGLLVFALVGEFVFA